MSKKDKALLIVEGLSCENKFFKKIESLFSLPIDIICMEANIYALYNRLKDYDFNCELKKVLLEILPSDKKVLYKNLLNKKIPYVYLVFDFELQHHEPYQKKADMKDNLKKMNEMLQYFNDETENGKLYVNYPMMESFRDLDSFSDENYLLRSVDINEIKNYKNIVSIRKLNGLDISKYNTDNFIDIFKLNIDKLYFINKILKKDKNTFFNITEGINIYNKIKENLDKNSTIYVLNTGIFILSGFKSFNQKYLNSVLK